MVEQHDTPRPAAMVVALSVLVLSKVVDATEYSDDEEEVRRDCHEHPDIYGECTPTPTPATRA